MGSPVRYDQSRSIKNPLHINIGPTLFDYLIGSPIVTSVGIITYTPMLTSLY